MAAINLSTLYLNDLTKKQGIVNSLHRVLYKFGVIVAFEGLFLCFEFGILYIFKGLMSRGAYFWK